MARSLTARQREILDYFSATIRASGVPPTVREAAAHFGMTGGGMQGHLKALRAKGKLETSRPRTARSVRITSAAPVRQAEIRQVPLIGRVRAGPAMEAFEDQECLLTIDAQIAPKADFAVRVRGDSMAPEFVDGDVAVIRKTPIADDGDVVLALIDDEFTLKRFREAGQEKWLEPANPAFRIIRGQAFSVTGTVVAVIRRVEI